MALRGLIHITDNGDNTGPGYGRICDIVQAGNEFEVHSDFEWVDLPDGTVSQDKYFKSNSSVVKFNILDVPGYAENAYKVARTIGYKPIGDQLDMLFKEIQTTGTISNTGAWANHIASIKAAIPKDDIATVHAWNVAYAQRMQGNV